MNGGSEIAPSMELDILARRRRMGEALRIKELRETHLLQGPMVLLAFTLALLRTPWNSLQLVCLRVCLRIAQITQHLVVCFDCSMAFGLC